MDVDFEPLATIEMLDEGIKLSTINKTVDAKGELLVERTHNCFPAISIISWRPQSH